MEKYNFSFKYSMFCPWLSTNSKFIAFFLILVLVFFQACIEKRMSLKKAKQLTVSMSGKLFVPPPRRIDDVLAVLEEPGKFDSAMTAKIRAEADALPPDTNNRVILANFYKYRGMLARQLGRYEQSLQDSRKALDYAERENGKQVTGMAANDYIAILMLLGDCELDVGNFRRGIALRKQVLNIEPGPGRYRRLAGSYITIGDFKAAEKTTKAGIRLSNKKIRRGSKWGPIYEKHRMQAQLLQAKGQFAEAESHIRSMTKKNYEAFKAGRKESPKAYLVDKGRLASNLANQGRLIEAEFVVREALKEVIGYAGRDSGLTADMLWHFEDILHRQGRKKDAEKLAHARIRIYKASGLSDDSLKISRVRIPLGRTLNSQRDFVEAMKQFDIVKKRLRENQYFYKKVVAHNPHLMLSLLKTGRAEEAMGLISSAYDVKKKSFGEEDFQTARLLGLRGAAYAMMGDDRQAIKDFSKAIPILIAKKRGGFGILLQSIIEAYGDLLNKIRGSQLESEFEIDPSTEIFRFANAFFDSSVQAAIVAIGLRAAALDPDLSDLVRREQDTLKQVNALQTRLSNVLATSLDQQNPRVIKDLKATIDNLSNARDVLLDEIKRRFPKYSDFTNPQPVTFSMIQKHLHPDEALVAIYPVTHRTYVWAIPHKGAIQFAVVPFGKKELQKTVTHLRKTLDPGPKTFGDIPEFDFDQAHDLYSKLFKPVEKGFAKASDLLVIAHGPLGQLPLSVLPTAPFKLRRKKGELFSNYRKAPWLIRKVTITRLPSASSFITLRTLPKGDPSRKAFAGFGDPFFNQKQLAQAKKEKVSKKVMFASRGGRLHVRGIRVTEEGTLDSDKITSSHIGLLNRLPDTGEEIRSIARALDANAAKDIFLGENASERQVKTMELSDRQVIAFATHGLVPGDLDGLDQPALALSSPVITGDNEDGLLTMGEILKLKLNADWVVLSACNTGAADGAGAEAVSGLGRAFFYAGTRAILVSLWPVETTAARALTTELFRYQHKNKTLSRAKAFRKSMLELIDGPGLKDNTTGQIIASYAHPIFWAPFIVVGDGG